MVKAKKRAKTSQPSTSEPPSEPSSDLTNAFGALFGGDARPARAFGEGFFSNTGDAVAGITNPAPVAAASASSEATPVQVSSKAAPSKTAQKRARREMSEATVIDTIPDAKDGLDDVANDEDSRRLSPQEKQERDRRTVFIGNVPLRLDQKGLRKVLRTALADKYEGSLKPIWFRAIPLEEKFSKKLRKAGAIQGRYNENAADSKNAYVVCATKEGAEQLRFAANGLQADATHVLRADGVGQDAKLQSFDRKRSVFVGNLDAKVSEDDLRSAFASTGEVDAIRIVRDKVTRECKGFAFLRFKDRGSVRKALDLWGAEINGRWIRVMKVEQQTSTEDGGQKTKESYPATRRIENKNLLRRRKKAAPANAQKRSSSKGAPGKAHFPKGTKKEKRSGKKVGGKSSKSKKAR